LTDTRANPQTPTAEDGTVTVREAGSHKVYLPQVLKNRYVKQ